MWKTRNKGVSLQNIYTGLLVVPEFPPISLIVHKRYFAQYDIDSFITKTFNLGLGSRLEFVCKKKEIFSLVYVRSYFFYVEGIISRWHWFEN